MAELKLNIYDGRKISKTYTAEEYDLMTGTVEDIINLIDVEGVINLVSDTEADNDEKASTKDTIGFVLGLIKTIKNAFGIVKPLLKDMFEGLTDEEIRHTRIKDIAMLFVNVAMFGMSEMKGTNDEKNQMTVESR